MVERSNRIVAVACSTKLAAAFCTICETVLTRASPLQTGGDLRIGEQFSAAGVEVADG